MTEETLKKYIDIINSKLSRFNVQIYEDEATKSKFLQLTTRLHHETGFIIESKFNLYSPEEIENFVNTFINIIIINEESENRVTINPVSGPGDINKINLVFKNEKGEELSQIDIKILASKINADSEITQLKKLDELNNKIQKLYSSSQKSRDIKDNYKLLIGRIKEQKETGRRIFKPEEDISLITNSTMFSSKPSYEIGYLSREHEITPDKVKEIIDKILSGEINSVSYNNRPNSLYNTREVYIINLLIRYIDEVQLLLDEHLENAYKKLIELQNVIARINELPPKEKYQELESLSLDENPNINFVYSISEYKDIYNKEYYERYHKSTPNLPGKELGDLGIANPYFEDVEDEQLIELQERQEEGLSYEDKCALAIYKGCFYKPINRLIEYMRNSGIDIEKYDSKEQIDQILNNDENIRTIINEEYRDYHNIAQNAGYQRSGPMYLDGVLAKYGLGRNDKSSLEYKEFIDLIFKTIPILENVLQRFPIEEDLTVYRGKNSSDTLSPKYFVSTSLSSGVAKYFIEQRIDIYDKSSVKNIRTFDKITIPAGSPVIAYNNRIIYNSGKIKNYLNDNQQEILIDGNNFYFSYGPSSYFMAYMGENRPQEIIECREVKLIPKENIRISEASR